MNKKSICCLAGAVLFICGLVLLLAVPGPQAVGDGDAAGSAVSVARGTDLLGFLLLAAGAVAGLMFTKAPVIAWRELSAFFLSPIAYILMGAYLIVVSLIFNYSVLGSMRAHLEPLFGSITWLTLFLCPLITMRLLSEEARSGTLETMLTVPVTDVEITIGKFLGALAFYVAMQVPTLAFVYVVARQGSPDYGMIFAGYLGVMLLGSLLISIGLFISSFTKNQVIAAFLSIVAIFVLFIIGGLGRLVSADFPLFGLTINIGKIIEYADASVHYMDFTKGLVMSQHVLYYISLVVFFLFLTVRMVESHKWR